MSLIRKFKNALFTLFNPNFWIMNEEFNPDLDEWLQNAMKHYKIEFNSYDKCLIKIDGKILWNASYPYASFTYMPLISIINLSFAFGEDAFIWDTAYSHWSGRPSRLTIYEFNKIVQEQQYK